MKKKNIVIMTHFRDAIKDTKNILDMNSFIKNKKFSELKNNLVLKSFDKVLNFFGFVMVFTINKDSIVLGFEVSSLSKFI